MLAAKFGTRWVVVTGSLLMTVGFLLGTFADRIEILYVTFGCIVGKNYNLFECVRCGGMNVIIPKTATV